MEDMIPEPILLLMGLKAIYIEFGLVSSTYIYFFWVLQEPGRDMSQLIQFRIIEEYLVLDMESLAVLFQVGRGEI